MRHFDRTRIVVVRYDDSVQLTGFKLSSFKSEEMPEEDGRA